MNTQNIFVFDFDGTIADTFHHLIDIGNQLAEEFHFNSIKPAEINQLKDMHVQEIIRHLNIPLLKVPAIVAKAKMELHDQIHTVQPVEGLKNVLLELKNLGVRIGILTSNSKKNVFSFLQSNGLDIFDFVKCTSKIWSKNRSIKTLIHEQNLNPSAVVYIGDETRDISAAHKAAVESIAVTWGYNSHKALQAVSPHHIVHKPEDLLGLLK